MAPKTRASTTIFQDEDLPATFRTKDSGLASPLDDLESFLASDLSVDRLEHIAKYLWLAGRSYPPRALNLQAVLERTIAPLHLVWVPGKIYIKPLPRYFFTPSFFQQYLQGDNTHGSALGLLFTYTSLIPNELDFDLAKEQHLLPSDPDVSWQKWKDLSGQLRKNYPDNSIYDCKYLPMRYKYGELRLGRLNKIYRCVGGDWLHGFSSLTGMSTYRQFFSANIGFITSLTVYIALVLTAMQVGLAVDGYGNSAVFRRVCWGFTIFSIIGPMGAGAAVAVIFLVLLVANWARAVAAKRARFGKHQNEMERVRYHKK
ncbi:unnamed protein product [Cercospora beticola]|nr:unnamed protein product [Cercospora beticola]